MPKDIFYDSRRLKRQTFFGRIAIFFIFLGIAITALIAFFYIPYFKIRAVSVSGSETLYSSEIEKSIRNLVSGRKFWVLPLSSIFILSEDMVISHLSKNFPKLHKISMKIEGLSPAALAVNVQERTIWAVVCNSISFGQAQDESRAADQNSCFYASSDGFLFGPAPKESGSLFLRVQDEQTEHHNIGDYFLEIGELNRINLILESIKSATAKTVDEVAIKKNEIFYYEAESDEGWKIIFDSKTDPKRAAENFTLTYKNTLGEDLSKIEYIDLRFKNRIFYKEK